MKQVVARDTGAASRSERAIYSARDFPIFQNRVYDTLEAARKCPRGDIELVQNLDTGLVYNRSFDPDLMVYDEHYQNEQGLSATFRSHLEQVAGIVRQTLGTEQIVEVGCGKGSFLEMLTADGFDVSGFDPTYQGSNPRVSKRYFDANSGLTAKGLVLRHVLEHIRDPVDFLFALQHANGGGGKVYIEVPCFDWIVEHRAWFDLFYEHVNYFRLADFVQMFEQVEMAGRVFADQYLYVVADLACLRHPCCQPSDWIAAPIGFDRDIARAAALAAQSQVSAVWGGASKGVIFSLLMQRLGRTVDVVIDINPAKQHKFLPATGLQVLPPAEALAALSPGSTIFVMNSNYFEEIAGMVGDSHRLVRVDDVAN